MRANLEQGDDTTLLEHAFEDPWTRSSHGQTRIESRGRPSTNSLGSVPRRDGPGGHVHLLQYCTSTGWGPDCQLELLREVQKD